MTQRSPRLRTGTLFRFDSVPAMIGFCRRRYPTAEIRTDQIDGEFVLLVRGFEAVDFESLIVHFEGEQTYAVMLPATPDKPSLLQRLRARVQDRQ